jgi:hypothetical protein
MDMSLSRAVAMMAIIVSLVGVPRLASPAPGGPQSGTGKGVPAVRNPRELRLPPGAKHLLLIEELTIGRGEDKNCQFAELRSVQADSEGRIYAIDGRECTVKVFDAEGRFLRTIGRKGQGPGEFSAPSRNIITPQDDLVVLDVGNRRLSFFKKEGELIKELSTAKWRFVRFRVNARGEIYADLAAVSEQGQVVQNMTKFSPDLATSTVLASEPRPMAPDRLNPYPPGFVHGMTRDGGLAWAVDSRYEIAVVDPHGKPRLRILKDPVPNPIREQDRKAILERDYKNLPAGMVVDFPSNFPPIWTLVVADTDHILVRTYVKDEKGGYVSDVFDPWGRFVAQFALGEEEFAMMARDGKLYTLVREDAEGLPLVKRYRMVWK